MLMHKEVTTPPQRHLGKDFNQFRLLSLDSNISLSSNTDAQASYNQPSHDDQSPQEPERKRRPGRPRGSKNRRPRVGSSKLEGQFYYGASPAGAAATSSGPPHHPSMNAQNQQYYEFQWRVLNLCAEFYGAAEELVVSYLFHLVDNLLTTSQKGTAPLVVAQCYHMGPGVKVDPLSMLGEAKRICDTLARSFVREPTMLQ